MQRPIYLDTNIALSLFLAEAQSEESITWLEQQDTGALWISGWVQMEYLDVLGRKIRRGDITRRDAVTARESFLLWQNLIAGLVRIQSDVFPIASAMLETFDGGLTAPDALHLAICARHDLALKTYDRDLAKIARKYGIASSR